jgi:branched-chain amino acid transport system substrate-binding protein
MTNCITKPTTVSVVYDDDPFSIAAAQQFEAYAKSVGITVVSDQKIEDGQPSYLSTATALKTANADMVWAGIYDDEATLLLPEISQLAYKPQYMYSDGSEFSDPGVVAADGPLTVGCLSGVGWYAADPVTASQLFVSQYKAKTGSVPTLEEAGGYQSAEIMVQALKDLGNSPITRTSLRNVLAKRTFGTIYGNVKFAKDGQGTSRTFMLQIESNLTQSLIIPATGISTIHYLGG